MPKRYISLREKRQDRGPFRLYNNGGGEASLVASVIGQAVNDYVAGDDQAANDARWYFVESYPSHASLLGLPEGMLPDAIRDRVGGDMTDLENDVTRQFENYIAVLAELDRVWTALYFADDPRRQQALSNRAAELHEQACIERGRHAFVLNEYNKRIDNDEILVEQISEY